MTDTTEQSERQALQEIRKFAAIADSSKRIAAINAFLSRDSQKPKPTVWENLKNHFTNSDPNMSPEKEIAIINKIKNPTKRTEALSDFNIKNKLFAKQQFSLDPVAQIVAQIRTDKPEWTTEITKLSDEGLRDRHLFRCLKSDVAAGKVPTDVLSLDDYKKSRPEVTEFANSLSRNQLERREIVSRMNENGLSLTKAKLDFVEKNEPEIYYIAKLNLRDQAIPLDKFEQALTAEVNTVKNTIRNAESLGIPKLDANLSEQDLKNIATLNAQDGGPSYNLALHEQIKSVKQTMESAQTMGIQSIKTFKL